MQLRQQKTKQSYVLLRLTNNYIKQNKKEETRAAFMQSSQHQNTGVILLVILFPLTIDYFPIYKP